MQTKGCDLDRFDRAILEILGTEGRLSVTDLAARVGLSKSPVQARLKRLETEGIITGYRATIDPARPPAARARRLRPDQADRNPRGRDRRL